MRLHLHNELGRLADERIYQADLTARLNSAGISASREVPIEDWHISDLKQCLYLANILVADKAVYEVESRHLPRTMTDVHAGAELLTADLQLVDASHGRSLYQFSRNQSGVPFCQLRESIRRSRKSFSINARGFTGNSAFSDLSNQSTKRLHGADISPLSGCDYITVKWK